MMIARTRSHSHLHHLLLLVLLATSLPAVALAEGAAPFTGEERERIVRRTAELEPVQQRHAERILALPQVHGFGIGLDEAGREPVLLVVIDPGAEQRGIPREIEGVAVRVVAHGRAEALHGGNGCNPCHAGQATLPVRMGNSTSPNATWTGSAGGTFCGMCTLGFKACEVATQRYVFVTNAHCEYNSSRVPGSAAAGSLNLHRGLGDSGCLPAAGVGTVSSATPLACAGTFTVDAASVTSHDGLTRWRIRDIGFPAVTPATMVLGDLVQKSGRTTGRTMGQVIAVAYSANVSYPDCVRTFTGQIYTQVTPGSCSAAPCVMLLGGDSGSALLTRGANPAIGGLLFAGPPSGQQGVANPITNVLTQLGVSLDPADCPLEPYMDYPGGDDVGKEGDEWDEVENQLAIGEPGWGVLSPQLDDFRDRQLRTNPRGQRFVRDFYRFLPEIVGVLRAHPDIRRRAAALTASGAPAMATLQREGRVTVRQAQIADVQELLADIEGRTPPGEFLDFVRRTREALGDGALLDSVGISVAPDDR